MNLHHRLLAAATLLAASRALLPTAAFPFTPRMAAARKASRLHATAWRPGAEVLQLGPSALCSATDEAPRLARDEVYAAAVIDAWRDEVGRRNGTSEEEREGSVCMPFVYDCPADGSQLHGCVYRKSPPSSSGSSHDKSLPGVVLFHTRAGPQDVFLRWKADSLVHARDVFGEEGCVVLIADILGDPTGWAWHDRTKYDAVRKSLLIPDEQGERKVLSGRAAVAIDALAAQPGVDPDRIMAMGYCLGGHPILELARWRDSRVRALATFHGVFDGVCNLNPVHVKESATGTATMGRVLVCTGADDPFGPPGDLDAAAVAFEEAGYRCEVKTFAGTRHGFTNPGQASNPNEAFGYSAKASREAWSAALSVLGSAAAGVV